MVQLVQLSSWEAAFMHNLYFILIILIRDIQLWTAVSAGSRWLRLPFSFKLSDQTKRHFLVNNIKSDIAIQYQ